MAESYMIPYTFAKLHPKYKTPVNALYLIGALSVLAPFAGRKMLVWIVDAGNFGCCIAYCMVSISFIILRSKEPDMERPYKVKNYKLVGIMAVLMSGFMVAMYLIPGSGAALVWQEWIMAGGWCLLGAVFCIVCRSKYRENSVFSLILFPTKMQLCFSPAMKRFLLHLTWQLMRQSTRFWLSVQYIFKGENLTGI